MMVPSDLIVVFAIEVQNFQLSEKTFSRIFNQEKNPLNGNENASNERFRWRHRRADGVLEHHQPLSISAVQELNKIVWGHTSLMFRQVEE